jgi:hypothetical protein
MQILVCQHIDRFDTTTTYGFQETRKRLLYIQNIY